MVIAVDFDGTIVEHRYPQIGQDIPFAIETLKELQKQDNKIILWTYRAGEYLDEAVDYCQKRGLHFYAVNSNEPDEEFDARFSSRKIYADVYIDDRNIGGLVSWSEIWQLLNKNTETNSEITQHLNEKGLKSWFRRKK